MAAADPWLAQAPDTWADLVEELRIERPLHRRYVALKRRLSRVRDPSAWRHWLCPLDKHVPLGTAFLGRTLVCAFVYLSFRAALPRLAAPGSPEWCVALVWVVALTAGEVGQTLGVPKALAMLGSGVALVNIPTVLDGLQRPWSRNLRAGAAALMLLRAGLGIDLATIRGYGWTFPVFTVLPSIMEAVLSALAARAIFGMPYLLALSIAFICAPVGFAVITSGCAVVKERGYERKVPSFLQACCSFDDAFCMVCFQLLLHGYIATLARDSGNINLAFGSELDGTLGYALPPLIAVFSVVAGLLATLILSATCLWCTAERRTVVLLAVCAALQYATSAFPEVGSGVGPVANLVCGLGVRHAWRSGWPRILLSESHAADVTAHSATMLVSAQKHLAFVWETFMFPLMFGLLGATFNTRAPPGYADSTDQAKMDVDVVNQTRLSLRLCCGYVAISLAIRCVVSLAVARPFPRYTRREQLYLACAWCTKGSTQAAFATLPRYAILRFLANVQAAGLPMPANAADLRSWSNTAVWCAVSSVFLSMPLGLVFINTAPFYLLGRAAPLRQGGRAAIIDQDIKHLNDGTDGPLKEGTGELTADERAAVGEDVHQLGLQQLGSGASPMDAPTELVKPSKTMSNVSQLTSLPEYDIFAPGVHAPGALGGATTSASLHHATGLSLVTGIPRDLPQRSTIVHVSMPPSTGNGSASVDVVHSRLTACVQDCPAAVVYFHTPETEGGSAPEDGAPENADARSDPHPCCPTNETQPSVANDAAQPAHLWLSYMSVAPPAEAAVRRVLLRAGLDCAAAVAAAGSGDAGVAVTLELRRVDEPSLMSTHPNVWEDPNDVMQASPATHAEDRDHGNPTGWRRLGLVQRVLRASRPLLPPSETAMPPLSTQRRRCLVMATAGQGGDIA